MDFKILLKSGIVLRSKFIKTAIVLLIAIVIYAFIGFIIQGKQITSLIISIYPTLISCGAFILPILIIKLTRWRLIGSSIGIKIPLIDDAKCWLSSQAFLATPGGSGLAIRSLLLEKKHGLRISSTLSAIIFERLTDVLSILVIFVLNISFLLKEFSLQNKILITICLPIIVYIFYLILQRNNLVGKSIFYILCKINPKEDESNINLMTSLRKLFKAKLIISTLILGTLTWSIEGYALTLILKSLSINWIAANQAIFAHAAGSLLGALSLFPGGLLTTEITSIGVLGMFGVPIAIATASTILIRLLTIWLASLIGMIFLFMPSKNIIFNNKVV